MKISFDFLTLSPLSGGNFGTGPAKIIDTALFLEKPTVQYKHLLYQHLTYLNWSTTAKMPVLKPLSGDNPDAPQQFKQPSRKGKKAWRKNVDVTDVQKGLEERVEQIIQG